MRDIHRDFETALTVNISSAVLNGNHSFFVYTTRNLPCCRRFTKTQEKACAANHQPEASDLQRSGQMLGMRKWVHF